MSQAGYTAVKPYYSITPSAVPSAADLAVGEIALNVTDKKLYAKDNSALVVEIGQNLTLPLAVNQGGTGSTTAATARTALGATGLGSNMFTLSNPSAVTYPRFNADNTISALSASALLSALGATTVGNSLFSLANPSAVTYLQVNADNSVSALSAAAFRTAIGLDSGLVLLGTATASSSASCEFTSLITSTYDEYVLEGLNIVPATDGAFLLLRTSPNNGISYDSVSGDYYFLANYQATGTPAPAGTSSLTFAQISLNALGASNVTSQGGVSFTLRVINPLGTTARKHFFGQSMNANNGTTEFASTVITGVRTSTAAVNALQFLMNTGAIASGTFRIYGVKK